MFSRRLLVISILSSCLQKPQPVTGLFLFSGWFHYSNHILRGNSEEVDTVAWELAWLLIAKEAATP